MEGPPPPLNPHLDAQLLRDKEASVRFELAQPAKAARLESVAQWDGTKAWGIYGEWVERTNPLNVRNPYHPGRPAPLQVPDVLGESRSELFSTSWEFAGNSIPTGRAYLDRTNPNPNVPGNVWRLSRLDPRNTYPPGRRQEPVSPSIWDTIFRTFSR